MLVSVIELCESADILTEDVKLKVYTRTNLYGMEVSVFIGKGDDADLERTFRRCTTVRHTPLWATLWSIFSSWPKEHSKVKCLLSLSCSMATTRAIVSTIPENIRIMEITGLYCLFKKRSVHPCPDTASL